MQLAFVLFIAHILASPAHLGAGALDGARHAQATADGATDEVLVRVRGDAAIARDERVGLMVVVDGDARVEGTVQTLAIVRGAAVLENARVGTMLVYEGRATLGPQTVVGGDLHLIDSELERAPDAVVIGEIIRDQPPWQIPGIGIVGALFGLGVALVFILAAVLAAALAPHGVRRAGHALTGEIGKTLLAAIVVWIAIPVIAGFAMFTVFAAPLGLSLLGVALPVLAFLGYLVAGIRVGDMLLTTTRRRVEVRPIGAAAVGVLLLLGLGLVPILGPIVNVIAVFLGAGALGLSLWRLARSPAAQPDHAAGSYATR